MHFTQACIIAFCLFVCLFEGPEKKFKGTCFLVENLLRLNQDCVFSMHHPHVPPESSEAEKSESSGEMGGRA